MAFLIVDERETYGPAQNVVKNAPARPSKNISVRFLCVILGVLCVADDGSMDRQFCVMLVMDPLVDHVCVAGDGPMDGPFVCRR